jgi:hypothetical protein
MGTKKFMHAAIAMAISGLLPVGIALADKVSNDVDASVDVSLEVMNLVAPNAGSVVYDLHVEGAGADGDGGCNLDSGAESVTFSVISGNASVATVSPSSITFVGSCSDTETVTVTGVSAGSTTITLSQTANTSGGSFNVTTAAFTVNVGAAPVDTTKPVITYTLDPVSPDGDNGWYVSPVSVEWTCTDETSLASDTVTLGDTTLSADGEDQTVDSAGDCIDTAGNVADPVTVSNIDIDQTAPTITASITAGTPGLNDWYTSDVTVHFECSDNLSDGVVCPDDEVLSDEGDAVAASTPTVTDLAGNVSAASNAIVVKIDKTGPSAVSAVTVGATGNNGWYVSDVTVSTTGTDSVSEPVTCTLDQDVTGETAGTMVSGSCTNDAGLTTDAVDLEVKIDQTAPVITITTPAEGDAYVKGSVVTADWDVTDALSETDTAVGTVADGASIPTSATGSFTLTVTGSDLAGNFASLYHSYTVYSYDFGGFKSPVSISAKDFKKMSTVPVKFQLINELTGLPVQGPAATLSVNGSPAKSSGGSNVADAFRYDAPAMQYIYNLSTKSLNIGVNNLLVTIPGVGTFPVAITIK